MLIRLALLAAAWVLAGCAATTPTSPATAKPVDPSRLLRHQTPPEQAHAVLIVTRDSGFQGSACYYSVGINGQTAARLGVEETARFFLLPGEYVLRAGRDLEGGGLCAIGKEMWSQQETTLRPGETKRFRLRLNADGMPDIQRAE